MNIEDDAVRYVEGFADLTSSERAPTRPASPGSWTAFSSPTRPPACGGPVGRPAAPATGLPGTTAVISTWNKREVVLENLASLEAQTLPFASIVVVDNASTDGTAEAVAREFPNVRLVVMPNDAYGACETFNVGFASATTPYVAILDDDITLPPEWLEKATRRMLREPDSTAVVSSKVVEPGMPESYRSSEALNTERYMSTFRGCGSLAKTAACARRASTDERLFIYGNERDLTCRLLNRGYRVLQYPEIETYHKTPFGIQMGKRSLYYHARNAFLSHAEVRTAWKDLVQAYPSWPCSARSSDAGSRRRKQSRQRSPTPPGRSGSVDSIRKATPGAPSGSWSRRACGVLATACRTASSTANRSARRTSSCRSTSGARATHSCRHPWAIGAPRRSRVGRRLQLHGEAYLGDCLRALQALDPGVDEIIVVDNASEDASLELLRREFPRVPRSAPGAERRALRRPQRRHARGAKPLGLGR